MGKTQGVFEGRSPSEWSLQDVPFRVVIVVETLREEESGRWCQVRRTDDPDKSQAPSLAGGRVVSSLGS